MTSSPFRQFEPSWVASAAQGTVMVTTVKDSLVICVRSPSSDIWKPDPAVPSGGQGFVDTLDGIAVTPVDSSVVQFAPSWLQLGPNSLCFMTGLASDVEHLSRVLQQKVETHSNLYDKSISTHALATAFSKILIRPTIAGGRPYAIQSLLVGTDDIDADQVFGVYSLDPSGAWQSWGGTTAIGKYAKTLRTRLAKERNQSTKRTVPEAIRYLLDAWTKTCSDQGISLSDANDDCQIFVLRKNGFYQVDEKEARRIAEGVKES